jgi:RHS repeat-associated protein
MYRLKTAGPTTYPQTIDYYDNGNIKSKSDGGIYAYNESGKPYTLSTVTNPYWDEKPQLNIDYTVMSRPKTISNEYGLTTTFTYNDNYDRAFSQFRDQNTLFSSTYSFAGGKCEIETVYGNYTQTEVQNIYLDGSPYTASIIISKIGTASPQTYYIHRDYLGSVMQITDNLGNLADENSYDAWGVMRDPEDWYPLMVDRKPAPWFGRGFTGHEYIAPFIDDNGGRLINMNSRLYDPLLGRFLAPDPYVGSGLTNDFNRYIYARNNPLMYTDPSGQNPLYWLGMLIYSGISYLAGVRDNGYKDWTPKISSFQLGYSTSSGGYGGVSFNNGQNYSNVGWNNGLTTGSTSYGLTYMSYNDLSVDPVQYLMQKEQEIRYDDAVNRNYQKSTNAWIEGSNYTAGVLSTAGSYFRSTQTGSFRLTNGAYNGSEFSPKYYPEGWGGGSFADITTYSVSKMGGYLSLGAGAVGTGFAYYQLTNGSSNTMTLSDATVGTIGFINSVAPYFGGAEIPFVGEGVAVYGTLRLTWDTFFWLGQKYGPSTWYGTDETKWFK